MGVLSKAQGGVAIIGRVPPPYGGVSVHLTRLLAQLEATELPVTLYDLSGKADPSRRVVPGARSLRWFLRFLLTCTEAVVHLHTNRMWMMAAAAWVVGVRSRKLVVTLHSSTPMRWYQQVGPVRRWLWRISLVRAAHIICVNEELKEWLLTLNVAEHRLSVVPAFIPPSHAEVSDKGIPEEVREFCAAHSPLLASHGWFGYFVEGVHVYSFDMLYRMLPRLRAVFPKLGLCTVISGIHDEGHREEIHRIRRELNLTDHWLIIERPFSASALYARSDAFVRPTTTDGDSVSIRECLALGTPVAASDCVQRPPGCVLFGNRDVESAAGAVEEILKHPDDYRRRCLDSPVTDASVPIAEIYRRLLAHAFPTGQVPAKAAHQLPPTAATTAPTSTLASWRSV